MNERLKVLELLQEGKLTIEQADVLLSALDAKAKHPPFSRMPNWDRATQDFKSMGEKLSQAVSQTMTEIKKGVETQFEYVPFWDLTEARVERRIPDGASAIHITSKNGKIDIVDWDEPYAVVSVVGQVRADDEQQAEEILEDAITAHTTDHNYHLQVKHRGKKGLVASTHMELKLPREGRGSTILHLDTKNGAITIGGVNVSDIHADTLNGAIRLFNTVAKNLHIHATNGRIVLENSVHPDTLRVYAETKNGMIQVVGLHPNLQIYGLAKTLFGRVQSTVPGLDVQFKDMNRRNEAIFHPVDASQGTVRTDLHLETKNGQISMEP